MCNKNLQYAVYYDQYIVLPAPFTTNDAHIPPDWLNLHDQAM